MCAFSILWAYNVFRARCRPLVVLPGLDRVGRPLWRLGVLFMADCRIGAGRARVVVLQARGHTCVAAPPLPLVFFPPPHHSLFRARLPINLSSGSCVSEAKLCGLALPPDARRQPPTSAYPQVDCARHATNHSSPHEPIVYRSAEQRRDHVFGIKRCDDRSLFEPGYWVRGHGDDHWSERNIEVMPAERAHRTTTLVASQDMWHFWIDSPTLWMLVRPFGMLRISNTRIDILYGASPPTILFRTTRTDVI